jgi:hypothetical protein
MDRVREWATYCGVEDMVTVVTRDLAREVLALRAEVTALTRQRDEAVAVAREAVGAMADLRAEVTTLTRQRDKAVALAREALAELATATGTGYIDVRDVQMIHARLTPDPTETTDA